MIQQRQPNSKHGFILDVIDFQNAGLGVTKMHWKQWCKIW